MIGIYAITHATSGRVYIGSSIDIDRRFREHKQRLVSGKSCNKHMQRAWDLYGHDAFVFSVVEVLDSVDRLIEREQYHHGRFKDVYNVGAFVDSPIRGTKRSAEWRANMSELMTAPAMRAHMAEMVRTRRPPANAESRKKMSSKASDRMKNQETRDNVGIAMVGVWAQRSAETRASMMASMRAKRSHARSNG